MSAARSAPIEPGDSITATKKQRLDPELPALASNAAIELDNVLIGGTASLDSVRRLGEKLLTTVQTTEHSGQRRSLMDASATDVVGRALGTSKAPTLEEFAHQTYELARRLASISAEHLKKNVPEIREMRDFCLSLSRYAQSYLDAYLAMRPKHPHRR